MRIKQDPRCLYSLDLVLKLANMDDIGFATHPYAASARAPFQMESTGAHRTEAMPSDGLRRRRRPRRTEAKTIRVESLLGHRTFSLELDLTETIAKVKAMIYEQEGTHPTQQVLIFREQRLNNDHRTLADYGVQHGPSSSLLLDTRLHGGDPPEVIQRLSYRHPCFLSKYNCM